MRTFAYLAGLPAVGLLVVSVLPFLLVRRPVSKTVRGILNAGFLVACVVWFFAGLFALGISLS